MVSSHTITIGSIVTAITVFGILFGVWYSLYSQDLQNKQKEFEIKTGLRTEMIGAISKPVSLAQQVESNIRNNTPPVEFSTNNRVVLTEANSGILESKQSIGEKLNSYFPSDANLSQKWTKTVDATYNLVGLSLVDKNTTRMANINKQILPNLEKVLDNKTFFHNGIRINDTRFMEKFVSILSNQRTNNTDAYPTAWNKLVELIFQAQQNLSKTIMTEKAKLE